MRLLVLLGASVLGVLFITNLLSAQPVLQPGETIMDGANPLDVGLTGYAIPYVIDWNNDGAKDLLVGKKEDGKILLFLNQGTNITPVFNGYTYLQSAGMDIQTPPG